MSQQIGYQSGVRAAVNRLRDLDPKGTAAKKGADGKWLPLNTLPPDMSKWGAWDKLERTLGILVGDHDAGIPVDPDDPPPPPPPPTPKKLAPQTYNRGSRGQDAKYCTQGLPFVNGAFQDEGGFRYDDQGLCYGGRSGAPVAGLKPSDEMDGRGPCDPYTNGNLSFPPWPAASYEV